MLSVTIDQVMSWGPCDEYTREHITELFAGRETITALDIIPMDIPAADKLWAVLREELVPAAILYKFACALWGVERTAQEAARTARMASWVKVRDVEEEKQVAILQTLLQEEANPDDGEIRKSTCKWL